MLIEITDESKKTSFIVNVQRSTDKLREILPFTAVLNVWKHEVYFLLPGDLGLGSDTYKVELGKVYYWPPSRALCLFYGFSEPYTPVARLGEFVGGH